MKTVEIAGAQLKVVESGAAKKGTIILLHGGRGIGDHSSEFSAYRALADEYRVIAYDQRGCGESSLTPPYTFERLADDVEELRKKLVDGPIILQGGSFGGMIALLYATRHPDNLTHLILRGTTPSYHHEEEVLATIRSKLHKATSASYRMVEKIFSDDVIDDTELRLIWLALQPLYFETFDPDDALEKTRKMHFHAESHNALFRNQTYDVREKLRDITARTLVICGAQDWICPPSQSRMIAEGIPGARLLMVEGANHAVHHEKNALVLSEIRSFLDGK